MKKIFLLSAFLYALFIETKAQQELQLYSNMVFYSANRVSPAFPGSGPDKDYDLYIRRSKNYRAVGWSTLIGGVVISGIGLLVANSYNTTSTNTAGVLLVIGAASGIVSIPFMIMASAYKRKAKLIISNQKTGFGVPLHINKDITGITIQIPIGK